MKKLVKLFLLIFVLDLFVASSVNAAGATLFLSPASGEYTVGKTFNISVMVDSGGGVGINAAEGEIAFDTSLLSVASVSESGSIFKLWTTNPTFSNSEGKITFGGGSPESYKGTTGKIFSVTFSAKKVGEAVVSFKAGTVLAADGKGTNIFGGFGNAKYTIKEVEKKEEVEVEKVDKPVSEETEKPKGILPPLPEISSLTHPDSDVWYSNNEPEFTWKVLPDLTGVSFMITELADSNPGETSDGVVETKKFEKIEDGEWYFHIKYQNKFGWGQVSHKKILVDSTPPEAFKLAIDNGGDSTDPSPKLRFKTNDVSSGVDYFNIIVNGETTKVGVNEVSAGYYQGSPMAPGEYEAVVVAFDKANNSASSSAKFTIDPLKAPIITSIPKTMNEKDELVIQGTSFYPGVSVKVYIGQDKKDPLVETVETDDSGNWSYFHKGNLDNGTYEVWAKIIDQRGAQSSDSARYLLIVEASSIIEAYGIFIIIGLCVVIFLLILFILYEKRKCREEKERIKRETEELKAKLGKIFAALREELDELIELADKKAGLSDSERKVKEKLRESLDISEEFLGKEVEDVEKEITLKKRESKK